ncbi:PilZ domain-containing protein [Novosphingobium pentaromativorans]|nr:PilZ domain-containing protein [Novosphingobium pentaromativorans]
MLPRRYIRRPVSMSVQCRTHTGMRDRGVISDISIEGCCIRPRSLFFKVGTRVMIRPEGMEVLTGVVRWNKDDVAGIEFDRPMYGPVVDYLVLRHGPEA